MTSRSLHTRGPPGARRGLHHPLQRSPPADSAAHVRVARAASRRDADAFGQADMSDFRTAKAHAGQRGDRSHRLGLRAVPRAARRVEVASARGVLADAPEDRTRGSRAALLRPDGHSGTGAQLADFTPAARPGRCGSRRRVQVTLHTRPWRGPLGRSAASGQSRRPWITASRGCATAAGAHRDGRRPSASQDVIRRSRRCLVG